MCDNLFCWCKPVQICLAMVVSNVQFLSLQWSPQLWKLCFSFILPVLICQIYIWSLACSKLYVCPTLDAPMGAPVLLLQPSADLTGLFLSKWKVHLQSLVSVPQHHGCSSRLPHPDQNPGSVWRQDNELENPAHTSQY